MRSVPGSQPLDHVPADRLRPAIGGRVTDHRARALDVVVERLVDVGDLARASATTASQWSWKGCARRRREGEDVVEQLTAEERCRPGDRVREQQRAEVLVVVPRLAPVGAGSARHRVTPPWRRCRRAARRRFPPAAARASQAASGHPGRRASRSRRRGRHRQRPLEVAVEAEVAVHWCEHARVALDLLCQGLEGARL